MNLNWIKCEEGHMPEDDERYKDKKVINVLVTTNRGMVTKVQRQQYDGTDLEDLAKRILLIIISDYDKEDNSIILTTEELTDFMNLIFNYLNKIYTNYNTDMI